MTGTAADPVLANDFAAQWADVREDALGAMDRVGRSGWLVLGDEVREFEAAFAAWWGVRHAVGVASGLDAIEIALRAAGVGPGARVLTTPLTAFATTLAILRLGATPVFVDVDASGGLLLDRDVAVDAAVPVHLYGHPLDPAALAALGVPVVEDCAQSAGAARDGRPTGVTGVAAATSLYPTKNLGAMGDGGVLLTDDPDLAQAARRLRDYGQAERYRHVELGLNSRLDELHAAVLRSALLPRLDGWNARRAVIAARYDEALAGTELLRPMRPAGGTSANHLYPVEVVGADPRDAEAQLRAAGVMVGRHYPVLCVDQPAAAGLTETVGPLDVARRLAERELSLPVHPYLDDAAVDRVIEACLALR